MVAVWPGASLWWRRLHRQPPDTKDSRRRRFLYRNRTGSDKQFSNQIDVLQGQIRRECTWILIYSHPAVPTFDLDYRRGVSNPLITCYLQRNPDYCRGRQVVPTGIEPVTQGFSVLCSTNWAMAPCAFALQSYIVFLSHASFRLKNLRIFIACPINILIVRLRNVIFIWNLL